MRQASLTRKTGETDITLALNLDGTARKRLDLGVGFLEHMLTLFAKHGRFDLDVTCKGDTQVDDHHSVEDIGITLGAAFRQALGDPGHLSLRRHGIAHGRGVDSMCRGHFRSVHALLRVGHSRGEDWDL